MAERRFPELPLWLDLILRLIVGATFVYASLDKIAHPGQFAQVIFNYRMVPAPLLHPMALLMPWVEMVAGLAVITGLGRRGGGALLTLLTGVFIVAIGVALARGLDISCGCFDTANGHAVGLSLMLRDVGLLAACLALTLGAPSPSPSPRD